MRQFIKFTFASCLGVFIAFGVIFFLLFMFGISAAVQGTPKVKTNSVLRIAPAYPMPELTNNTEPVFEIQMEDVIGVQDLCRLIEHAGQDDNIQGIYLEPTMMQLGLVTAQDVLKALREFKSTGKFVLTYANFYEQLGYYLASVSDTIILNPIGVVDFRGFASFNPFYKEMLDKVGVKMQIYYAGEFKSATEAFRRTDMSPENKFQVREFLDDIYGQYLSEIADNRGMDVNRLRSIADGMEAGNANAARETGLVDIVGYEDEALAWMRKRTGLSADDEISMVNFDEYYLSASLSYGEGSERIAVLYAEGPIVHSGEEVYAGISDKHYVDVLRDLRKNDRIKAVVLRVNSPGGNILAAENILREIRLLQDEGKPFVVSMSDYAASGGYYVSCTADSIFAEASTLTGSIGVFSMFPNPTELLNEKLGVSFDTVRTMQYSASFSPFFEWSDAENEYLQRRTDDFYTLFLQNVSQGRDRSMEEVDSIARGRIWSGTDALEVGLIDRIGSLEDAVGAAAALAGLEEYRITEYPRLKDPWTKMLSQILGQDIEAVANGYVEGQLEKQIPAYHQVKEMLSTKEPQARLPIIIKY